MAPEQFMATNSRSKVYSLPPRRLSIEGIQRSISDLSIELSKETIDVDDTKLTPISEVEDAKCECCGMSEECTHDYIRGVRNKFCGRWICGLCSEAVNEEMEKNGDRREEALAAHTSMCARFSRIGRTHPLLYRAEAMKEILRKYSRMEERGGRAKSCDPCRDKRSLMRRGIDRSSSCIPAITRETNEQATTRTNGDAGPVLEELEADQRA